MDHPAPTSRVVNAGHCASLRHKGMYVMAEDDPKESRFFDAYDATAYWCVRTQRAIGPDGRPVHPGQCQMGRGCCE
jgi:hypothetical protein